MYIIKCLHARGLNVEENGLFVCHIDAKRYNNSGEEFILAKEIRLCTIENGSYRLKPSLEAEQSIGAPNLDHCLVVVDEAHHLFEMEVGDIGFGMFGTRSLLASIIDSFPLLDRLLLLSDMSQSWLSSELLHKSLGTEVVETISLSESVRCTTNIITSSACYGLDHSEVKSHHDLKGYPIKTFLYRSPTTTRARSGDMISKKLELALHYLTDTSFEGLDFTGRLAILVPNEATLDKLRFTVNMLLSKFELTPITALNNTKAVKRTPNAKGQIVFDTIDHFDGLESLIVIGLDFDQPTLDNEGRSACYRLITRAQMLFILVGPIVKGGYFEWLQQMDYDAADGFDDFEVDNAALCKLKSHHKTINQLNAVQESRAPNPPPHPSSSLNTQELSSEIVVYTEVANMSNNGGEDLAAELAAEEAVVALVKPSTAQLTNQYSDYMKRKVFTSIIDTTSNEVSHEASSNDCDFLPIAVR
jgi:hypothetical protein